MAFTSTTLKGLLLVTNENPDPTTSLPQSPGQQLVVNYTSWSDKPDRERRRRPPGDAFDTWTPRRLREAYVVYRNGTHVYRALENTYDTRVAGPASYWAGPPPLDDRYDDISSFSDLDLAMRHKIKNQKVNLLQAFGERKQTAGLLKDLLVDTLSAARELRKGFGLDAVRRWNRGDRSRTSKAIASRWLQYQYGIKPLMSDIYGTAEVLSTHMNRGFPIYLETGMRTQENTTDSVGIVLHEVSTIVKRRIRVRYMYEDSVSPDLVALGITNPALLLWELTPWSFVADWAINMGKYLGGLDALLGVSSVEVLRSYTKTSAVKSTVVLNHVNATMAGYSKVTERFGKTSSLSFGELRLSNPFAVNGVVRALNSLALTRAQFR